ncbi:gas vesicle protein [Virgibacillus natechei]|uniref:Gas vesicle protein n=1 Tax=Virgibacillus natechei TaxID=1216297 RepID=A0ABS4IBE2_9BACI|nr:YlbD family protein [Virgibacillus natechei]MBP1968218.1 gas vesicle protein [Virgibacillus natechei]UZD14511.1 YlbD family protein [Virgibacillus natechei]
MNEEKLHPTVLEFKQFINKHPLLREEVRKKGRSWQEYYEKWALLGEDDSYWEPYKEDKSESKEDDSKESNKELLGKLMKLTENMDIEKVQNQAHQLNNSITMIQEMISQFQDKKNPKPVQRDLFNLFRD